MDANDDESGMKKTITTSSLRHLDAALASTACSPAKILLALGLILLTKGPILVVPGLEHPHQQNQQIQINQ